MPLPVRRRAGCAALPRHRHCATDGHPLHPTALTSPLTIMHLLAPAPVGGLETVVSTLAAAQSAKGHRVVVAATISSPRDGKPFFSSFAGTNVEVVPLVVPGRGYWRERNLILDLCRARDVSVVHTHGYRSDIVGGLAARKAGTPIVTTVHGFAGGGLKNRTLEAIQRRSFRYFDAVVVVSRPQSEQLRAIAVPEERLHVLPNALGTHPSPLDRTAARRALQLPASGVVIGWVGRTSREKGVDVFVDAIGELADPRIHAVVIGDGPERAHAESRASELTPGQFHWPGALPDAARYFAAFDLYVLSSHTEGLPMVLLEAMSAGVPIVTTSVGGIPDMLSPNEAVLVPPNDPSALAAAIRAAIDDPDASATRARNAQRLHRDSYSVTPWSDRYEAIYRSILHPQSRIPRHS
jgi:glycosyltransferase involved in cell wall biosynthesis